MIYARRGSLPTDLAELLTQRKNWRRCGWQRNAPIFRVIREGERQTCLPALQDEVYRIARELLRNAFQHGRLHVALRLRFRYDNHLFRVLIRDDGKGMAPKVLKEGGQAGHWDCRGVRERAKQIGRDGFLEPKPGARTEVQLTVPVSAAQRRVMAQDSGIPQDREVMTSNPNRFGSLASTTSRSCRRDRSRW